ncbi:MAG: aminotransferase class V-fold PLP-dependent enzyme [Gemmatimonadaceae bacterium]
MTLDVDALRTREFPWAGRGEAVYLNNASTGPLPQRTLDALAAFNIARGAPFRLTEEMQFGTLARSRELIARLIGASPDSIALAVNTSFGINLAAFALPLRPGEVVLASGLEFPANVYPWMALAQRRGVTYRPLPTRDGLVDEEALFHALDRAPVRVVAISWVGFATGYRVDLAAIGRACRARGAYLVVDAIQGLGPCTLDVAACHVDILACGAQKWLLSPWGAGFVYVRDELVSELEPNVVSWMAVRDSDDFTRLLDYDLTWRDNARRFEQITLPYQDFAGMNASLELLHELGPEDVARHTADLVERIVAWTADRSDVELITPRAADKRAGIAAIRPRDADAASRSLREAGITHALREGAIRLSPYCYNTREEIDRTLAVLARAS